MSQKRTPKPAGVSSGSTLLNLATTGKIDIGYECGTYNFFVGDSNSGKSVLAMYLLTEAANNPDFDHYRLIYDNVEDGIKMDMEHYFGRKVMERLEAPAVDSDMVEKAYSATIEDFYFNLDDAFEAEKPFVYVLDSIDALDSEQNEKYFDSLKKALRKDTKAPGSYGDGKAKANSQGLRRVIPRLRDTGSILLVINQTRDKIDAMPFGEKRTRAGGRALSFYAQVEIWSSVRSKIKKEVAGKERVVGTLCEFKIKRSRYSGRELSVQVPIVLGAGLDDLGSMIDYLLEEKHWDKKGGKIIAKELDLVGDRETLIKYIEEECKEEELRGVVKQVWEDIEDKLETPRKKRYE